MVACLCPDRPQREPQQPALAHAGATQKSRGGGSAGTRQYFPLIECQAMIRIEIEEIIDGPIEQVFDRLIDIPGYAEWMPNDGLFLRCELESDEPIREGTAYLDQTRLGTVRGEVVALDRPHALTFHYVARMFGRKMMDGWPRYRLRREGPASTRVHHVATGQLHGPFNLLRPVIQRLAQAERQRTVDALKNSFESTVG